MQKRTLRDELEGLSVFVFVSPESGQTLVENCAAGWRLGSGLEPEVGLDSLLDCAIMKDPGGELEKVQMWPRSPRNEKSSC